MTNKATWGALALTAIALCYLMLSMRGVRADEPDLYANRSPEVRAWYRNVELTEQAQQRFPFKKCCDHSDVFHTRFMVDKSNGSDAWFYQLPDGSWKQVPPDIIHWFNAAPDGQPTLFIYAGQETCFFPPDAGI